MQRISTYDTNYLQDSSLAFGAEHRKGPKMATETTRRDVIKSSLAMAGLGVLGFPEWAMPALAQGERLMEFTDLPDESIEIEGHHRRGPDDRDHQFFEGLAAQELGQLGPRAVGGHQRDVDDEHQPAATKQSACQASDRGTLFHPLAVEDPDDRQVLDIVKDLEQRDAHDDVVDHDHREPPEGEADGHGE